MKRPKHYFILIFRFSFSFRYLWSCVIHVMRVLISLKWIMCKLLLRALQRPQPNEWPLCANERHEKETEETNLFLQQHRSNKFSQIMQRMPRREIALIFVAVCVWVEISKLYFHQIIWGFLLSLRGRFDAFSVYTIYARRHAGKLVFVWLRLFFSLRSSRRRFFPYSKPNRLRQQESTSQSDVHWDGMGLMCCLSHVRFMNVISQIRFETKQKQ